MAILTSTPGADNKVSIYDVPEDVLGQYAITGDKAAQMFPESKKTAYEDIVWALINTKEFLFNH